MKKSSILCLLFSLYFGLNTVFAQENLNEYKYIIVPNTFEFFKESNRFQLNALTKFLFNKYGFTAILDNENYPQDLGQNKCLALQANLLRKNSLLKTRLQVELRNCTNEVIYISPKGESRQKETEKAYQEALRKTFKSFETVNYKYQPSIIVEETPAKETIANETKVKEVKQVNIEPIQVKDKIQSQAPKSDIEKVSIEQKPQVKESMPEMVVTQSNQPEKFYAKPTQKGYELYNSLKQFKLKMHSTLVERVYMFKDKNISGVILKRDSGQWVMEYLDENNIYRIKKIDIVFQ